MLFTDAGHRMQGAITESATEKSVPDSYLSIENGKVALFVGKELSGVTKITASLLYDVDSITLSNPMPHSGKFSQEDGNIILVFDIARNIPQGTQLIIWDVRASSPESHTVNLSDVQVETTTGNIDLSTKGTGVF